MSLYEVTGSPTWEKIENYDSNQRVYYRFQNKDWEMGDKSWGMIFSSEEDALENCEDWGMSPEDAILNGKSCCDTAKELINFTSYFDSDFRIIVLEGDYVEEGHDGESVVDVEKILEIWDFYEFTKLVNNIELI